MDSPDDVVGALNAFSLLPGAGSGVERSSSGSFSVPASSGENSSVAASQGSVSGNARKRGLSSVSSSNQVEDVAQFESILDYLTRANGGDTNAVFQSMKSGNSLYEDFAELVARDRAITAAAEITPPLMDEDFVGYLARTNGIRDEKLIRQMRDALMWDGNSKLEQPPVAAADRFGQSATDVPLCVGEGEDAMSFFVRAGSWDSSSSISQDLASAGLAEDEDAASYLMRTGNLTADSDELSRIITASELPQLPANSGLSSTRPHPGTVTPGQGKRKLIATESERLKREKLFQQIGQTV